MKGRVSTMSHFIQLHSKIIQNLRKSVKHITQNKQFDRVGDVWIGWRWSERDHLVTTYVNLHRCLSKALTNKQGSKISESAWHTPRVIDFVTRLSGSWVEGWAVLCARCVGRCRWHPQMLGYGKWGWACGATKLVFVILIDFGPHSFAFVIVI